VAEILRRGGLVAFPTETRLRPRRRRAARRGGGARFHGRSPWSAPPVWFFCN